MGEVVRGVHGGSLTEGRGLGEGAIGGVLWVGFWGSIAKRSKKNCYVRIQHAPPGGPSGPQPKRVISLTAGVRSVDLSSSRLMPLPPALCCVADMNACYLFAILNRHRVLHWPHGDACNSP